MYKEDVLDIDNGTLLNHKMNKIMPFTPIWMELEIIIPSEVSQKEKDKYHMIWLRNLKYDTNYLWNRNRLTDVKNRLVVAKGRGKRRIESF